MALTIHPSPREVGKLILSPYLKGQRIIIPFREAMWLSPVVSGKLLFLYLIKLSQLLHSLLLVPNYANRMI